MARRFTISILTAYAALLAWADSPHITNGSISAVGSTPLTYSQKAATEISRTASDSIASADAQTAATDSLAMGKDLKEVVVLANSVGKSSTTSYVLGRSALDHHQMINLKDISTLLPGGTTVNPTLTDDSRLALRASAGERGNPAYGTAIEIDGIRLDNNGAIGETNGTSTRAISASSIESVEVISGIPSVEYGDISNGVVKVTSRRGESPWIIEGSMNPYTRQISLNKGFTLQRNLPSGEYLNLGILNFSLEHARSFTSTTSPHTSYARNSLQLSYSRTLRFSSSSLNIRAIVGGNIGGFNSKSDPDAFTDTYQKARDNQLRCQLGLSWLRGPLRIDASTSFTCSDNLTTSNVNKSSSSAQPMLHTLSDGYFIATPENLPEIGGIVLGPTGYWYELSFNDQKPRTWQAKVKATYSSATNKLLVGAEYKTSRNAGKGLYYTDLALAPTWRPYRYCDLPALQCAAAFIEDVFTAGNWQLTAGLRDDITMISGSGYGTVSSLSPRASVRYSVGNLLNLHAGVGKSVKLPSFQILYPQEAYCDRLAFTPGSTADNRAYYAFYTFVSKAERNTALKWQHTNTLNFGCEFSKWDAHLSVSAFYNRTVNPYQQVNVYTPVNYNYTSQADLEGVSIPAADRLYSIDPASGVVSVGSTSGTDRVVLPHKTYYTCNRNSRFVNGSPVNRYGIEWILDLPHLYLGVGRGASSLTLRLDGKLYFYKGRDTSLIAGVPGGVKDSPDASTYIGYYRGSNVTSASTAATPSVSCGAVSRQCNLNATLTLQIPRISFVATVRFETSLLNYKRQLFNGAEQTIGWPEYYSTWEAPDILIPFAEAYAQAITDGDTKLANDLQQLIKPVPTDYYFKPRRLSPYYSANIQLTKQLGRQFEISFYANNFFNTMRRVRDSQTGLSLSIYNAGYVPSFYYGLSLRVHPTKMLKREVADF